MSDDTVITGTPVSAERQAQFNALVAFFDPKTSMDRIDAFAKWIFASSTVVGVLGVGLVNGVVAKAHGLSLILFTAAVAFLGVSLTAACWSIAPQLAEVYVDQLESMREEMNKQFAARERHLRVATVFYALALLTAAAVPLTSLLLPEAGVKLTYTVDATGSMSADAIIQGDHRAAALKLDVERQGVPLASAGSFPGASGDATLHLGPVALAPGGATDLILWRQNTPGASWTELRRVSLQH